ncbi:MAG: hypothetical protein ACRD68_11825, partial [Pyrinomonadaceae bacterium]
VWEGLDEYRDYGFAVFKLKATRSRLGGSFSRLLRWIEGAPPETSRVHPMAFEFPTRRPGLLFFPTVHVHDRRLHPTAQFDHVLYYQEGSQSSDPSFTPPAGDVPGKVERVERSWSSASSFIDIARAEGIVAPDEHCMRMPLGGRQENRDTWVGEGGDTPRAAAA